MASLIDEYNKEELEQIVQQSYSLKEVINKLGYSTSSGRNNSTVKKKIQLFNINTDHFTHKSPVERTEENVFIENSTASQATLRRWYIKGEYTPYICSICNLEPIWQGKELTLILDHINGHNKDNRLENLRWVCPNCNQQLETTGHRASFKEQRINKKHYYCIDCGVEIKSSQANRCKECAAIQSRAVERPSREELKNMIRIQPFTTLALKYQVSDNAIRKWCDTYNLPRKKTDIQKYSNEEWEKI